MATDGKADVEVASSPVIPVNEEGGQGVVLGIWYMFQGCFLSSVTIYGLASLTSFLILRKHKFGRFYSIMILFMGFVIPLTLGIISSTSIAFVYHTSNIPLLPQPAFLWGVGQTIVHALFGLSRVLATL
ncbi:hypothetical protein TCAL_11150 [Tigriopus californicus]|uniref:Transmembrane protein 170A n=1 Tax=Tigriopus californicus TaxID=6832 RepID=A0A553N9B6_TIGCA|nr:transmembrane protein 170A-like [Tigriopus californicus]TRY62041.1 hypothetical protein TCAL_11150 [Tigriopus californicus]